MKQSWGLLLTLWSAHPSDFLCDTAVQSPVPNSVQETGGQTSYLRKEQAGESGADFSSWISKLHCEPLPRTLAPHHFLKGLKAVIMHTHAHWCRSSLSACLAVDCLGLVSVFIATFLSVCFLHICISMMWKTAFEFVMMLLKNIGALPEKKLTILPLWSWGKRQQHTPRELGCFLQQPISSYRRERTGQSWSTLDY